MQVPTADAGAKDVQDKCEKCEKCETLEKSLKKAELKVHSQRGEVQSRTRAHGILQRDHDELTAKYTELKKITEVCGVDVCVHELLQKCVCMNCCINVVIYRDL